MTILKAEVFQHKLFHKLYITSVTCVARMRIKEMAPSERPREKFMLHGPEKLSDPELLAIMIRTGRGKDSAIDISNRMLSLHPLDRLAELSHQELQEIPGIGPAKALEIKASFELAKRAKRKGGATIRSARDVYELYKWLEDEPKEHFVVILLDSKNRVIYEENVSIGTLDSTLVHPREVFRPAVRNPCAKMILLHNHPSGDPSPSKEDLEVTERMMQAGRVLDIPVLDHVIIGKTYWSYSNDS